MDPQCVLMLIARRTACRHGPNPPPSDITVHYVRWCIDPNATSDKMQDPGKYFSSLERYRSNVCCHLEVLLSVPCEFPRIDERFLMKKRKFQVVLKSLDMFSDG
jgi:hypothetical protein